MSTEKTMEQLAADAVRKTLERGDWIHMPVAAQIAKMGMDELVRQAELAKETVEGLPTQADPSDIDDQGWVSDGWAAWRLVLRDGENPAVVYFSREPTYAERKAFAAAAKVPVASAVAEARPK